MSSHALTLNLPDPVYRRLQLQADASQRTIEEETLDMLLALTPETSPAEAEWADVTTQLDVLDDASLWDIARNSPNRLEATELEQLHLKRQREPLNDSELKRLADLMHHYERNMLARAHAALLLKNRGHDVSTLISS